MKKHTWLKAGVMMVAVLMVAATLAGCVSVKKMVYGYWKMESYSDPDGSNSVDAPSTLVYHIKDDNTLNVVTPDADQNLTDVYLGDLKLDHNEFQVINKEGKVIYSGAFELGAGTILVWFDNTPARYKLVAVELGDQ